MLKSLKNNILFKQIGTLASGVAIAQIIVFLSQIILRRLFTIEVFGAYDIYYSIINVATAFVTLRYENAIILTKYNNIAVNLVSVSIFFTFIFSLVLFLFIYLFTDFTIQILNFPIKYSHWLYFAPLSVLLFSIFQIINNWLIRNQQFRVSSANKIIRRFFEGVTQIIGGLATKNIALLVGDLIGNFSNVIYGSFMLKKSNFKISFIRKKYLFYSITKYKEFPLYNLLPNLLNTLSLALPVFIISFLYSSKEVALFNFSRQILLIPTALLAGSIAQVVYRKVAELKNQNQSVLKTIKGTALPLFLFAVAEIIFFVFFGKAAFSLLFGEKWAFSGSLSSILVIAFSLQLIISPFGNILWVFDKIKLQAIWQTFYFIVVISLYFVKDLAFKNFINLFTILLIIIYLIYALIISSSIMQYEKSLNKIQTK